MFGFLKKRKRGASRVDAEILFKLVFQGKPYNGILKDISTSGFRFAAEYPFKPGDEFDLVLDITVLQGNKRKKIVIEEKAIVRWIKPDSSMSLSAYNFGCQFLNLSEEEVIEIKSLVENHTEY